VTLAEYAGPTALGLGSLLLQAKRASLMPAVVEDIERFANNLETLSESDLGEGTAAGAEALELAGLLRRGALLLHRPAGSQELAEAVKEMLSLLHHLAERYGGLIDDDDEEGDEPVEGDQEEP
jgi:hypothetical protein